MIKNQKSIIPPWRVELHCDFVSASSYGRRRSTKRIARRSLRINFSISGELRSDPTGFRPCQQDFFCADEDARRAPLDLFTRNPTWNSKHVSIIAELTSTTAWMGKKCYEAGGKIIFLFHPVERNKRATGKGRTINFFWLQVLLPPPLCAPASIRRGLLQRSLRPREKSFLDADLKWPDGI